MARSTSHARAVYVRKFLREWRTLNPTKEAIQILKETMVLDGYHRDYVANICFAFRDYGRFIGLDLAVKPPSPEKPRPPRFLTEHEVQAFLFPIDSIRDRALFSVLAYTGLRCAELCAVKREHLDFEKKTLMVENGKGGKSAEIPISRIALDAVSAYLRAGGRPVSSPWLFPDPKGGRLCTNRVRVLAHRYGVKAGLQKHVNPHAFRHSLATNLLARGCPLPFVQRQLRHARIETTMGYLHLTDQNLRDNYERFLPEY